MREKDLIIPTHIAFILDGNRRWAKQNKSFFLKGHFAGLKTVHTILNYCQELDVKHLTLYAFSTENNNRNITEKNWISRLASFALKKYKKDFVESQCRVKFIGNIESVRHDLKKAIYEIEELTAQFNERYLNIAFNYGGRWDILQAAKEMALSFQNDPKGLDSVDEKNFHNFFSLSHQPDPEILIRTGGTNRISNFLLWELAYTELFFTSTLWPDFSPEELLGIIKKYNRIKRNFGK